MRIIFRSSGCSVTLAISWPDPTEDPCFITCSAEQCLELGVPILSFPEEFSQGVPLLLSTFIPPPPSVIRFARPRHRSGTTIISTTVKDSLPVSLKHWLVPLCCQRHHLGNTVSTNCWASQRTTQRPGSGATRRAYILRQQYTGEESRSSIHGVLAVYSTVQYYIHSCADVPRYTEQYWTWLFHGSLKRAILYWIQRELKSH